MACHVAILRRAYVELVLTGAKTVESRLTKAAVPPYRCVRPGERIFIKASGGPTMATAVAGEVMYFERLGPGDVAGLRRRFNERVCGDDAYWRSKRDARYATFVELRDVQPTDVGPTYAKSAYRAWHVLPDEAGPVLEVTLTAGAIRNRYVGVAGRPSFFGEGKFELELPGGRCVQTTLYRGQRVRWRGWGDDFERYAVAAGDRVRFVACGGGRYRVTFVSRKTDHDACSASD